MGGGGDWSGEYIDTFTMARVWGNYETTLSYSVYNGGDPYEEWNKFKVDIYCPAHETTDYVIEY